MIAAPATEMQAITAIAPMPIIEPQPPLLVEAVVAVVEVVDAVEVVDVVATVPSTVISNDVLYVPSETLTVAFPGSERLALKVSLLLSMTLASTSVP